MDGSSGRQASSHQQGGPFNKRGRFVAPQAPTVGTSSGSGVLMSNFVNFSSFFRKAFKILIPASQPIECPSFK